MTRLVKKLAGTRKATELIANSSRILICVDYLSSNGTSEAKKELAGGGTSVRMRAKLESLKFAINVENG